MESTKRAPDAARRQILMADAHALRRIATQLVAMQCRRCHATINGMALDD